ncbi:aspartate carbamoyltransferase regulatory subunit [Candidatus Woesearchaeota archaeon]|nr:MAG: aspartate carbamoyltransferase regulatory subunit [Candidatus Woesearchaeota archaeon]
MRAYKVYAIERGTVIDHIPKKKALQVLEILGIDGDDDSIITLGMNMHSEKMGSKDIIKIENKKLTRHELNKIAIIAPNATINIIDEHKVKEKIKVKVPRVIENAIKCGNPKCVTRHQPVITKFYSIDSEEIKFKCHYCEKEFYADEVQLL